MIKIPAAKGRYFLFNKKMYRDAIKKGNSSMLVASLIEFESEEDFLTKLKEIFDRSIEEREEHFLSNKWECEVDLVKMANYYSDDFKREDLGLYKVGNVEDLFKDLPFDKETYFSYTDQIPIVNYKNAYEREVQDTINLFKKLDPDAFYTALLLYDVGGIENPTREQIKNATKIEREFSTIYDEDVRLMVKDEVFKNKTKENEEEMG